jgi:hypothetical protein
MTRVLLLAGAAVLCLLGWLVDRHAFLASYLAAWWFCLGALLGGLANVWLHNLTGGAWGEAIRGPLLRCARLTPLACLLFLPLLTGMEVLYPWAAPAGSARWAGELSAPQFKQLWLTPAFFIGRSVAYLSLWSLLAWLSARPALQRSRALAAAGLIAYGFSASLAAVDWIMSLQPEWYSSVFGWLAATGQMLTGLALAVVLADREAARKVLPDLGNLLLMYVLAWAYLAYVQFLIIWAANLPHEIAWYLRRSAPLWRAVAWGLVVFHGALPLVILLSRHAKRAPRLLGGLACALLAAHLVDCWWLVIPSAGALSPHWLWIAPVTAVAFMLAAAALLWRQSERAGEEAAHV